MTRALPVVALALAVAAQTGAAGGLGRRDAAPGDPAGNGLIALVSDRSGNADIWTMRSDGSSLANLTNDPGSDTDPAWSPDGSKLAFTTTRDGNAEIYLMDADGTNLVRLTNNPAADSEPTWSPDQAKIAFTTTRDGNAEIYTMSAIDGSNLVRLTNNTASDTDPAWSPDGTKIAFTSNRTGNDEVFTMDAPGGASPVNLTNNPADDSQPAWSPDAARIAFTSDRSGNQDVYQMNADGTGPVDLTNDPSADLDPDFSPDAGARVAFTTDRTTNQDVDLLNVAPAGTTFGVADVTQNAASDSSPDWQPLSAPLPSGSPIQHVVIIDMENHSFDNLLGKLCVQLARCDGATTGKLSNGTTIDLRPAKDLVPNVGHTVADQEQAINGGGMDGWDLIFGCGVAQAYACYQQFRPNQVPTTTALARNFVISDMTFQMDNAPSWGAHLELATSDLDGFTGDNPAGNPTGLGWGCDSMKDADWRPSVYDALGKVPSCVPMRDGTGPYKASTVSWVPTIMDRLDDAGLSWKLYVPQSTDQKPAYGWAICPTFAECLYGPQAANMVPPDQFSLDAAAGILPTLSIVVPISRYSQHNGYSMLRGENWLGEQVSAVMHSTQWSSSVIFLTQDDCGCFYDHVPPPLGLGVRSPMIIISPFAKPGYTDSNVASYVSMLAFIEHTFGLAPMSTTDANAYDYSESFDYGQAPLTPISLPMHHVPAWEVRWIRAHPPDPDDPT